MLLNSLRAYMRKPGSGLTKDQIKVLSCQACDKTIQWIVLSEVAEKRQTRNRKDQRMLETLKCIRKFRKLE